MLCAHGNSMQRVTCVMVSDLSKPSWLALAFAAWSACSRGSPWSMPHANALLPAQALLVLSDVQAAAEVAAEVRQLEQDARPGGVTARPADQR